MKNKQNNNKQKKLLPINFRQWKKNLYCPKISNGHKLAHGQNADPNQGP